jgi:cellulose synthase/poly-beta-1,6-N-acetylglucosamine synthase-like glycosyltransferase
MLALTVEGTEALRLFFAAASPSVASWMATTALVWTTAGMLLLLGGWILLPRKRSPRFAITQNRSVAILLRIAGGCLIGIAAGVLAAILSGQGPIAAQLILTDGPPGLFVLLAREASGFARILGSSNFVGGWLYAGLVREGSGFARLGQLLANGFGVLARAVTFGAGVESPYVVANQVALGGALLAGGLVGWMSFSSRWNLAGVATYVGLDLMALGFIAFSLAVVETSSSAIARALGLWLIGTVLFGFVLFLVYQFYALEHIAGSAEDETRSPEGDPADPDSWPFVLVQIASYNEPAEIVKECLASVQRLDYPRDRMAVQLVDDSTDPATVRDLEAFCRAEGVDFQHRTDRRGFKGGALNDGLRASTDPVELVAIVDSDYVVDPGFLRLAVRPFRSPEVGFVQTPQAYRNVLPGKLSWWYELADAYFYRVVQPVRARFQSLIFCGTMGVLRRSALEDAGGWSETCVTEDAELTIRLLSRQWRGRYIPQVMGRGLAPDLMTAVRSQQRRWAFGGIQMLRINRKLLAGRQLTFRQRMDFRMTGLFWFDGIFLIGITGVLASLVVASWFGVWLPYAALPAPAIVAIAPVLLMVDGLLKIRTALRPTIRVRFWDVLGVLSFWYAIKLNSLRAAFRAWIGSRMPFVRTPKIPERDPGRWAAFTAALRSSVVETAIASALLGIVGASLVVWRVFAHGSVTVAYLVFLVWLVYYAYAFGSTLWFDYFSRVALFSEKVSPEIPAGAVGGAPAEPTS